MSGGADQWTNDRRKSENRTDLEFPADHSLCIVDGVERIHGRLVFGGISDEPLGLSESDIGRRRAVALVWVQDSSRTRTNTSPAQIAHRSQ